MSLHLPVCAICGRAVFPQRLLCPDCGSTQWRQEPIDNGLLEAVTKHGETHIGAIRTPLGPLVIARVEGKHQPGAEVTLDQDGNVPVAGR